MEKHNTVYSHTHNLIQYNILFLILVEKDACMEAESTATKRMKWWKRQKYYLHSYDMLFKYRSEMRKAFSSHTCSTAHLNCSVTVSVRTQRTLFFVLCFFFPQFRSLTSYSCFFSVSLGSSLFSHYISVLATIMYVYSCAVHLLLLHSKFETK